MGLLGIAGWVGAAGLVVLAVAAAWNVERVRELVGELTPYLPLALYLAVPVVVVVTALRPRLRIPGNVAAPLTLSAAVLAFLAPLVASWERGYRAYFSLAGLVPWSDAGGYYRGAIGLLFDNDLDDWSARRPLATAFLAVRMAVTGLDLRLALVLQAVALGVACYLAARAVARDLGPAAGLALFAALFGFAAFGIESAMTEPVGVTLGALAFAALWNAVRARNASLAAAGVFLLTLALNARAGPFFVLVALVAWFARFLRRDGAVVDRRALALGVGAVLGGFAANGLLIVALHGGIANSNGSFSYTLYGLATGNRSWTAAVTDYPELATMTDTERNRFVFRRALEQIREEPGQLALGLWRSGSDHLEASYNVVMAPLDSRLARGLLGSAAVTLAGIFVAVRWRSSGRRALLGPALFGAVLLAIPTLTQLWAGYPKYPRWFPLILLAIAYLATIVTRPARLPSGPWVSFMLTAFAGILVSLPLLPLIDTGVRVQAAVVPFFALAVVPIVVVAIDAVAHAADRQVAVPRPLRLRGWVPAAAGGALVAIILVGTPLAQALVSGPDAPARRCPDGSRARAFAGGVAVHVVGNEAGAEDELDEIDLASISPEVLTRWSVEIAATLGSLRPGTTIYQAYEFRPESTLVLVDGPVDESGDDVLYLCGETIEDPGSLHTIFVGRPLGEGRSP